MRGRRDQHQARHIVRKAERIRGRHRPAERMRDQDRPLHAETAERIMDERRLPHRRRIVRAAGPAAQAVSGTIEQQNPPPFGERLAQGEPHVFEIAAGAMQENQRRFVRGPVAQFGDVQSAAARVDKSPGRTQRAFDHGLPDHGDRGEQDKRDDNGNGQAEHPGCNSHPQDTRACGGGFSRPKASNLSGYQMSRPSTFSVKVLIRSGTRGKRGWIASALR